MDVEKIMAEERAAVAAEREAALAAWPLIHEAIKGVPGLDIDERTRRAGTLSSRLAVGDQIQVTYQGGPPTIFAGRDWEQAVELFVRNVARSSVARHNL